MNKLSGWNLAKTQVEQSSVLGLGGGEEPIAWDGWSALISRVIARGSESENASVSQSLRGDGDVSAQGATRGRAVNDVPDISGVVTNLLSRFPGHSRHAERRTLSPLGEWEGFVEKIEDDGFVVRMVDVKSKTSLPEELARFSKSEVADHQKERLRVGAIVRWVVGLEKLPTGQRRRVSELHFRRLPAYTRRDLQRATQKAMELVEGIVWDDSTQT